MTREEAERELSRERPILWGYTEDKVHILFRELLITERRARRLAEEECRGMQVLLDQAREERDLMRGRAKELEGAIRETLERSADAIRSLITEAK